jgi:hypothetical protein
VNRAVKIAPGPRPTVLFIPSVYRFLPDVETIRATWWGDDRLNGAFVLARRLDFPREDVIRCLATPRSRVHAAGVVLHQLSAMKRTRRLRRFLKLAIRSSFEKWTWFADSPAQAFA